MWHTLENRKPEVVIADFFSKNIYTCKITKEKRIKTHFCIQLMQTRNNLETTNDSPTSYVKEHIEIRVWTDHNNNNKANITTEKVQRLCQVPPSDTSAITWLYNTAEREREHNNIVERYGERECVWVESSIAVLLCQWVAFCGAFNKNN